VKRLNRRGFTIVELMIALTVMATILLISTIVLINLGSLFSKGTNQAHVQNATRNLINDVVGQIKLGPNTPIAPIPSPAPTFTADMTAGSPSGVSVVCVGKQRFTYVLNSELGAPGAVKHVLWRDTLKDSSTCQPVANFMTSDDPSDSPADPTAVTGSGSELVPTHTRLTKFGIKTDASAPDTWQVDITLVYGDSDLLTYDGTNVLCKGGSGDQYCAAAALSGTATQRLH
jgi:prepilin-type N-terminal cleavage/methylation domain-containing protein